MPKEYLVTMETGQENASKGELDSAEEEVEEDAGAAADDPDDSSAAEFEDKDFRLIWETPKFEKSQGQRADGSIFEQWTCLRCNWSWKKWNHTKALGHTLGGCSDIKQCKSITPHWLAIYQAIHRKLLVGDVMCSLGTSSRGEMRAVPMEQLLPALALEAGWGSGAALAGGRINHNHRLDDRRGRDVPPLRLTAVMALVETNAVGSENRRQSTGGWFKFKGRELLIDLSNQ
jgi:hypothetical protein